MQPNKSYGQIGYRYFEGMFQSEDPLYTCLKESKYMYDFYHAYITANHAYTLSTQDIPVNYKLAQGATTYEVTALKNIPNGMHGFILSESASNDALQVIKLCFRGVQVSEFSSVKRALDFSGPGVKSFIDHSDDILNQLEMITQQHKRVALEITGHSLGGADSASTFHDFLYHYVESHRFQNIEKVTLNVLNAPGNHVESREMLHDILEQNISSDKPIDVSINIAISDGDIVSQIGESPLANISAELANVQLCHVDKIALEPNSTWRVFFNALPSIIKEIAYIGHSLEPIFTEISLENQEFSPNFNYKYYNNQTQVGFESVNQNLNYKWYTSSGINFMAKCANKVITLIDVLTESFYEDIGFDFSPPLINYNILPEQPTVIYE